VRLIRGGIAAVLDVAARVVATVDDAATRAVLEAWFAIKEGAA
jgi:hypothetical protein